VPLWSFAAITLIDAFARCLEKVERKEVKSGRIYISFLVYSQENLIGFPLL
jgi:hypothetical protein